MTPLFQADPSHIFDFATKRPADIFNEAILPRVQSFDQFITQPAGDLGGLEEAARRRNTQLQADLAQEAYMQKQDEDFFAGLYDNASTPSSGGGMDYGVEPMGDYDTSPEPQNDEALPAKNAVDFIKHFEGYNPKAYSDYKQWSIGYGTKGRKGEVIDQAEAERRLISEMSKHKARVMNLSKSAGYNFSENEVDALTSFDYNTGRLEQLTANGKRSKEEIAKMMTAYNKAGGEVLPGLTKRRRAEQKLFTQGY